MILYILILLLIYFILKATFYRSVIDAAAGVALVLILIQQEIFK